MKRNAHFLLLAFYSLIFLTSHTVHGMNPSNVEEYNPEAGLKDSILCEEILNHSVDSELSCKPIVQRSTPLFRLSLQNDKEDLLNSKTLQRSIEIVKDSPDFVIVRSPLISSNATPLRSKTPPLSDDLLKPEAFILPVSAHLSFRSRTPPLSTSQDGKGKEGLSKPNTPPLLPQSTKLVIEKTSPNLVPVRSPLTPTRATPFRSRTPSPLNP